MVELARILCCHDGRITKYYINIFSWWDLYTLLNNETLFQEIKIQEIKTTKIRSPGIKVKFGFLINAILDI